MEFFNVFVANPALIALIAGLFFGAFLLIRNTEWARTRRINTLLIPATVWLLWAIWEWGVMTFSPEANIRVDLLIIIPLALIASAAGIVLPFLSRPNT